MKLQLYALRKMPSQQGSAGLAGRCDWLEPMPDTELEPLEARPDPAVQAIFEYQTPLVPTADQRGDVNYLCGHCRAIVIQGIRAGLEPKAPPPGLIIRCSNCSKYSLFRMSFKTHDREFASG